MEINISELRRQKRPLWMTDLGVESSADLLGGGGDLFMDRLPVDTYRGLGMELAEGELPDALVAEALAGREEDYLS